MGSAPSLPESIYQAVQRNNQEELKGLCAKLGQLGVSDPAARARVLEWRDKEGRTPLLVAASRNLYQSARLLLENGADVLFVNNAGRGNALHEAAHFGHEAMVELLLQHGAQPFMVNAEDKTPVDEAVETNNTNIARRLEREAPFSGSITVMTSTFAGLLHTYKPRWAVVMFRFPNPADPDPQLRKVLWLYGDESAASPKVKVWLDGARAYQETPPNGTDYAVCLHPTHPEPTGGVYTRYDHGYCIFFRPTSNATVDACRALVAHCNPSLPMALPAPSAPGGPRRTGQSVTQAAPVQQHVRESAESARSLLLNTPPYGAPVIQAAPTTLYPPPPQNPRVPPPQNPRAPVETAVATSASSQGGARAWGGTSSPAVQPAPASGARGRSLTPELTALAMAGAAHDTMQALPGETDQQFAARLAGDPREVLSDPRLGGGTHGPAGPAAGRETASAYPPVPRIGDLPLAAAPPAAVAPPEVALTDDNICVICLSEERKSGFLHGTTVHACACASCAALFQVGSPCPMCRAPVERVLGVF